MEATTDSSQLTLCRFATPLTGTAARSEIDGNRAAEFVTGHEGSSYEMLIVHKTYTIGTKNSTQGNFASRGDLFVKSHSDTTSTKRRIMRASEPHRSQQVTMGISVLPT